MPLTLEEILQRTRNQAMGFARTLSNIGNSPIEFAKGIGGGLFEVAKAPVHAAANIIQAYSPMSVSGQPFPIPSPIQYPVPGATEPLYDRPLDRVASGMAQLSLGLGDIMTKNVLEQADERQLLKGQPRYEAAVKGKSTLTSDEMMGLFAKAAAGTVKDAITPIAELTQASTGNMTARQAGEATISAGMKTAFGAGILGKFLAAPPAQIPTPRKMVSIGDVTNIRSRKIDATTEASAMPRQMELFPDDVVPEQLVLPGMEPPIRSSVKVPPVPDQLRLSSGEIASLVPEVLESQVFQEFATRTRKGLMNTTDLQKFQLVGEAIRRGAANPEVITALTERHGLSAGEAVSTLADALEYSVSEGGRTLNIISDIATDFQARALTGDAGAMKALDSLSALNKAFDLSPISRWGKLMGVINKAESIRRIMATGQQLVTPARNVSVSGMNAITGGFSAITNGLIEAAIGKSKGEMRPISDYFVDATHHWMALVDRIGIGDRSKAVELLQAKPIENARFTNTHGFNDARLLSQAELVDAAIKPVGNKLVRTITYANRLGEMENGKFLFQGRLLSNMERLGYKTYESAKSRLEQATEIDAKGYRSTEQIKIDQAYQNALDHAYKGGFRYNFTGNEGLLGSFAHQYLGLVNKNPFMTILGPLFPRFLFNRYQYLTERSPLNWLDMFNPEFRAKLMEGLDGGLKSAEATRHLAKGVEGMVNLVGAFTIRDSDMAGAKYYEVLTPDKKEVLDLSAYEPFKTYLGIAEFLKSSMDNKPWNISPSELTDFMFGVRRLEETPIFAIPDIIRSAQSEDPRTRWETITKPAGQYLAAFLTPLRSVQDYVGGVGQMTGNQALRSQVTLRDTKGQELLGPFFGNTPVLSATLPPRVDPFTGLDMETAHPITRQLTGLTMRKPSALETIVKATPGITVGDLIGDFGNQQANELVHRKIGQSFGAILPDGITMNEKTAEFLSRLKDPVMREKAIRLVFKDIKEDAYTAAKKEDPMAFMDHLINTDPSISPGDREAIRKMARKKRLLR